MALSYQNEIDKAIEVLNNGGTIIYPTDTIWGIGCDATNPKAVEKIYNIKQRTDSKSLIILIDEEKKLHDYVNTIPEMAWELIDISTSPLTIIYEKAMKLAPNLIPADGSIAIRITKDPFCRELIKKFKKPITSTSANISGEKSPSNYSEIDESFLKQADYVVNLRRNEKGNAKASSIIKIFENGQFELIRK
ncbi:MAG: L-threonylcarbamoyladenylate synthase [Bacteroidota bacterium]